MRIRSRLLCSLLGLTLACTHTPPARASNDGDLCSGLAMLVCLPVAIVAGIAGVFEPKSKDGELSDAVKGRRLEDAKRIMLRAGPEERTWLLRNMMSYYMSMRRDEDDVQLALITWMLEEKHVDVSGATGTAMLQSVVGAGPMQAPPDEGPRDRQLAIARLLIAHGARADAVLLGQCTSCNTDPAFLRLMMSAGADINRGGHLALYSKTVESGNLAAAEPLLALGADPDGRSADGRSLLQRIAGQCDVRPGQCGCSAAAPARCVAGSIERTRFAVAHGADPNGRATWEHGKCGTPYAVAMTMQNTALADALRVLGADPDFNARCLATASRQP